MNPFLTQVGTFLIEMIFGLYLLALLLRFLFQLVRADFYNPIAQFVVVLTNPILRPARRLIPGLFGIDIASVLLLIIIQTLELYLIGLLHGRALSLPYVVVAALVELTVLTLYVFVAAIIVRALLSWVAPYGGYQNPATTLLVKLTEPLLRPVRRWLPATAGIDLSPIVVLAVLWIAIMAVRYFL